MFENSQKLSKTIEHIFLAIAYISVLTCLVRTDYNFAFALFGYYLWISRDDKPNSLMLMGLNGVLLIADIIWYFSVASVWGSDGNNAWQDLQGVHTWSTFWSVINTILKLVVIGLIQLCRNKLADPQHQGQQLH